MILSNEGIMIKALKKQKTVKFVLRGVFCFNKILHPIIFIKLSQSQIEKHKISLIYL